MASTPLDITDPQNITNTCQLLEFTLSPDQQQRRHAEETLKGLEAREHFPVILLMITADNNMNANVRHAASIAFKNFLSRKYHEDAGLSASDRAEIKKNIVNVMVAVPSNFQKQISEAIMVICEVDFPDQWPTLLDELAQKLGNNDFNVVKGILFTAHSLARKYRDIFETEEVVKEMILVIQKIAPRLLEVFGKLLAFVNAEESRKPEARTQLVVAFECINLVLEIYYSLNWLDLPEFFEDNLSTFMTGFLQIADYLNEVLPTDADDPEPSALLQAKTLVCEIVNLYMEKYDEEFNPFVEQFAMSIWRQLLSTGKEIVFDTYVAHAIQFLTTVSRGVKHSLFSQPQTLNDICYKIVVPNVELREEDEEMFEDDPVEYIRRDIEGSDSDTRRRSAVELVKGLCEHYESQVSELMMARIVELLKMFATNPQANWKCKDIAFYLFTAISTRATTARGGATQVRDKDRIQQFLREQVAPELSQIATTDQFPILKSDAIKFVTIFRSQFDKSVLLELLPLLAQYLESKHRVVHTYAAWAIERIMALKDENKRPVLSADDLKPFAERLLAALFSLTDQEVSMENEYVMRAIMRLTAVLKENMTPMMGVYVNRLTQILARVCKNPTNPTFNHYIFESYATVIKFNPGSVQAFEQALTPPFTSILQDNVEEFIPYVLQIFTLLLETRTEPITQDSVYVSLLLPKLFDMSMWQHQGNIPGMVGLINSLEKKATDIMSQPSHLDHVLRIFQRLINSKRLDVHGFDILSGIVENIPLEHYKQHLPTVFVILFTRLQKGKTPKFMRGFVLFLSQFIIKFGPDALYETMEAASQGVFVNLAPVWASGIHAVRIGKTERRIVAVSVIKLLTECKPLVTGTAGGNQQMAQAWSSFLVELIRFLGKEKSAEKSTMMMSALNADEDEAEEEAFLSRAYKVEFSKLSFASKKADDPTAAYPDNLGHYVATTLQQLVGSQPALQSVFNSALSQHQSEGQALMSWLQKK